MENMYCHLIYQQFQVSNGIYFFRIICSLSFKTEPLKIYEEKWKILSLLILWVLFGGSVVRHFDIKLNCRGAIDYV